MRTRTRRTPRRCWRGPEARGWRPAPVILEGTEKSVLGQLSIATVVAAPRTAVAVSVRRYLNTFCANSAKFFRQSGQTCPISGASSSVNCTPFAFNHVLNCRLTPTSPSAVPQAISKYLIRVLAFAFRVGKVQLEDRVIEWCAAPAASPPAALGCARWRPYWRRGRRRRRWSWSGCRRGPCVPRGHMTNAPLNEPSQANLSRLLRPV